MANKTVPSPLTFDAILAVCLPSPS